MKKTYQEPIVETIDFTAEAIMDNVNDTESNELGGNPFG